MKIGFAASAAALLLISAHAFAQTQTARLVGTIHDASGAAIPNAMVSATQQETKRTSETKTNSSGEYVLGALQPGSYTIEFEAPDSARA
jgi:protocatechuate 3,4-dioxygenase beta subunit